MSPFLCLAITPREGINAGRQRCVEDAWHHGPHWLKTEPISCTCIFFCNCEPLPLIQEAS